MQKNKPEDEQLRRFRAEAAGLFGLTEETEPAQGTETGETNETTKEGSDPRGPGPAKVKATGNKPSPP